MKKNTVKNREKLAAEIINQMNHGTMTEALEIFYESFGDRDFDLVWKEVFGED